MSQSQTTIDSYIPDSIGSKDILFENLPFIGTVEFFDGVIVLLPAFLFLMSSQFILPAFLQSYVLIIFVFIAILGGSLLIIKPNYMTLYTWLQSVWDFWRRPETFEKNMTDENGIHFDSYEAVPDSDTRRLTLVSRVFPERNAIELKNGDIISILEFTGSNLDMASSELKFNVVESYGRSLSSGLKNEIQFYLPMRPVSLDSTKSVYEKNLRDKTYSVENEEFMERYLEDRSDWLSGLGDSSYIRDQFVVVKVTDRDAYDSGKVSAGESGIEKLPGGEIIHDIISGFSGGEDTIRSDQEITRRKLRELQNRVENVGSFLSVGPGNDYYQASTRKSVSLIKEFWEGEKVLEDEMISMKAEYPFPVLNDSENSNAGDQK